MLYLCVNSALEGQEKVLDPLELELQRTVIWVLGLKPGSFETAASAPKPLAISQPPKIILEGKKKVTIETSSISVVN